MKEDIDYCEDCEDLIEYCDCEVEEEDIDYGDPHEIDDYFSEMSALQEMDRVGPDYWKDPESGEMRIG